MLTQLPLQYCHKDAPVIPSPSILTYPPCPLTPRVSHLDLTSHVISVPADASRCARPRIVNLTSTSIMSLSSRLQLPNDAPFIPSTSILTSLMTVRVMLTQLPLQYCHKDAP